MLSNFYPHDAMLVEVLAMAVCLASQCSVERDGRSDLVLACRLLSTGSTLCYKENRAYTKIRVLPSNFFLSQD